MTAFNGLDWLHVSLAGWLVFFLGVAWPKELREPWYTAVVVGGFIGGWLPILTLVLWLIP